MGFETVYRSSPTCLDGNRSAIGRLVEAGAQGIVLGCTEIEILVTAADSSVPVFPTSRIHVEAAVAAAIDGAADGGSRA